MVSLLVEVEFLRGECVVFVVLELVGVRHYPVMLVGGCSLEIRGWRMGRYWRP